MIRNIIFFLFFYLGIVSISILFIPTLLFPKKGVQFDYHSIDKALKICFSHRRKKLKNNLKDFNSCIIDQIKNHNIDLELRPQDLKINEYIILSKLLTNSISIFFIVKSSFRQFQITEAV